MTAATGYLALEKRIATGERGGVVYRWRYGRELLEAKAGRRQLPHGMLADLVAAAGRAGLTLSEREVRYRVACAEAYDSEPKVGTAAADFGSWRALCDAGFPAVTVDESGLEPDELEAAGVATAAADEFEQLSLIPGLGETVKANGRRVPLDEATVADVKTYRDMYAQIHDNYAKRLVLIDAALAVMHVGSNGDDSANAVEAWKRGQLG